VGVISVSKVETDKRESREGLLHAVNNWIRLQGDSQAAEGPIEFLCECGADDCHLTLELTPGDYDDLAAVQNRRLLATQHLGTLDGHRVVAERDGYVVLGLTE